MKKVLIAGLLIIALCLTLAACNGSSPAKATTVASESEAPTEQPTEKSTEKSTEKPTEEPEETSAPDDTPAADPQDSNGVVHSTASFEDVVRSYYYTCQNASDDGIVRDYFTQAPIEFSYNGEDVVWYCYKSGGEFRSVCISRGGDSDAGMGYQVQWG